MDEDLKSMSKHQLIDEVKKLRTAIREHRDSSGHDLCWYQPELWSLLPESANHTSEVPEWPMFMHGCIKYRQSLDQQGQAFPRIQKEFE